jgi:hypothetical protein
VWFFFDHCLRGLNVYCDVCDREGVMSRAVACARRKTPNGASSKTSPRANGPMPAHAAMRESLRNLRLLMNIVNAIVKVVREIRLSGLGEATKKKDGGPAAATATNVSDNLGEKDVARKVAGGS